MIKHKVKGGIKPLVAIGMLLFYLPIPILATSSKAQNYPLKTTIQSAIEIVEEQTGYKFFFSDELVDSNREIVLNDFRETKIENVVKEILNDSELTYSIIGNNIVVKKISKSLNNESKQQQKTLKGNIKDENGLELIGVSVKVKGTALGTITDINGNFEVKIPNNTHYLEISYVGYTTQEVSIKGKTDIQVILAEDTQALEEVVVVAYGTQKKVNLTSAVEAVDSKILKNRPVKSVSEMLEGAVPNLNISTTSGAPDAVSSLNIRGFTGINSKASPLVLVDGAETSLDLVNPNDIENISVLKDAAGSAIYGSRAPFGVILITTKSGKKQQKMAINYSGTYQISQASMLPHSASSIDFARLHNGSYRNSLQVGPYSEDVMQRMQDYMNGKIEDNNIIMPNGWWGEHFDAHANSDYTRFAFRDYTQNTSHDLNMSGGNENTTYYAGVGYSYRQGLYDTSIDNYDRITGILKLSSDITKWLTINTNVRFSRIETERPNFMNAASSSASDNNFWDRMSYFPNIPIQNPDGSYHRLSAMPLLKGAGGTITNEKDDLWLTMGIQLKPLKGLTIKGDFSWNNQSYANRKLAKVISVEQPNGQIVRSARSAGMDGLSKTLSRSDYYVMDLTAQYQKNIKKNDFSILIGMQQELNKYESPTGSLNGFYTTEVPSFNTSWGDNVSLRENTGHWATKGLFFRLNYSYDDRYLLDINGRYDASSKYAANNRWAFFPSVSIGWNIAKENFWFTDKVSMLKVTGSIGRSGDQSSGGNYLYIPTMGTGSMANVILGGVRPPYVTMPNIISNTLTWTKPQTIGFGVELAAFNNRLQSEFYGYQRTIYDQLGPAAKLPEVLGVTPPQTNNAVSETRGWELSVSWRDQLCMLKGKPLNYSARFVLSDYIGYVVKYPDNISGSRNTWTPGQVFGKLYGYESAGIASTLSDLENTAKPNNGWYYQGDLMFKDLNGDGLINGGINNTWYSMGDLKHLGYTYPRYKYAFTFSLDWNNFNLSMFLDGVGREVRYIDNFSTFGFTGDYSSRRAFDLHTDLGYWTLNSTDAFFPRIYNNNKNFGNTNNKYLLNLAHLRIKNINLSYSVPNKALAKTFIRNLSLNLSIENLGMIYYKSWLKLDPQMLANGGNGYPIQRVYSLGVNLGF